MPCLRIAKAHLRIQVLIITDLRVQLHQFLVIRTSHEDTAGEIPDLLILADNTIFLLRQILVKTVANSAAVSAIANDAITPRPFPAFLVRSAIRRITF